MIIYREYLLTYTADTLLTSQPPPVWETNLVSALTPPPPKSRFRFFVKIHLLESSKLELYGFCLKFFFKILIIPHALHFVPSCIFFFFFFFCILPHLTVWHTVLVCGPPPPPPKKKIILFCPITVEGHRGTTDEFATIPCPVFSCPS